MRPAGEPILRRRFMSRGGCSSGRAGRAGRSGGVAVPIVDARLRATRAASARLSPTLSAGSRGRSRIATAPR